MVQEIIIKCTYCVSIMFQHTSKPRESWLVCWPILKNKNAVEESDSPPRFSATVSDFESDVLTKMPLPVSTCVTLRAGGSLQGRNWRVKAVLFARSWHEILVQSNWPFDDVCLCVCEQLRLVPLKCSVNPKVRSWAKSETIWHWFSRGYTLAWLKPPTSNYKAK